MILSKNVNNKKCAPKLVIFNEESTLWQYGLWSQKMSRTKNVLLNWYSSMKKKLRKIRMIFESQILALFDSSPLIQNSKFNNFLWVC